ncbi:MAG TPA: trigger factor, partial [Nitrospiria bacterium]|nr:trigger factor [Nitrospiria bacterium]
KAPLSLIEKRFGHEVEEDVLRKLIPDYYQKAVDEAGIHPVEFPAIERVEVKKDQPLSFTATVEVRPPIALKDYTGLPIVRKKVEVSTSDLERAINVLREEHGQLVACDPDHPIAEGDYAIIDFEGSIDGKPLDLKQEGGKEGEAGDRKKVTDYMVQVGAKALLPGFEESLIGKMKGSDYSVTLSAPVDHPNQSLQGKEIVFSIQVKEVKLKRLPDLDDEFAKDLGMESLEKLKERVSSELLHRLQSEAERSEKETVIKKLVEMHDIDSPPSLVQREMEQMLHNLKRSSTKADLAAAQNELESLAKERVKGTLILSAIADAEEITVSDADIEEEISRISKRLGMDPHETRRTILGRDRSLEGLRERIREEKTLQRILSKAQIRSEE